MKTNVSQLSIDSYYSLNDLSDRQRQVYRLLQQHGQMSNNDIKRILGLDSCCVTGRVYELREMGLVWDCGSKEDRLTGKMVTVWEVCRNI